MLQLPQSKASPDHSVWVPIANQPDSDWNPTARLEDWLEAGGSTPTDRDRGGLAARDPGRHRHPRRPDHRGGDQQRGATSSISRWSRERLLDATQFRPAGLKPQWPGSATRRCSQLRGPRPSIPTPSRRPTPRRSTRRRSARWPQIWRRVRRPRRRDGSTRLDARRLQSKSVTSDRHPSSLVVIRSSPHGLRGLLGDDGPPATRRNPRRGRRSHAPGPRGWPGIARSDQTPAHPAGTRLRSL